jgi:hypothetical protein
MGTGLMNVLMAVIAKGDQLGSRFSTLLKASFHRRTDGLSLSIKVCVLSMKNRPSDANIRSLRTLAVLVKVFCPGLGGLRRLE